MFVGNETIFFLQILLFWTFRNSADVHISSLGYLCINEQNVSH